MMRGPLAGRIALVSGAPGQAGQAIVRALARAGCWVAVNFRQDFETARWLVDVIRSEGGRALPVFGDVDRSEEAWAIVERIDVEWGPVEIVVENSAEEVQLPAGREPAGPLGRAETVARLAAFALPKFCAASGGQIIVVGPRSDELVAVVARLASASRGSEGSVGPTVSWTGLINDGGTELAMAVIACCLDRKRWHGYVVRPSEILGREAATWG